MKVQNPVLSVMVSEAKINQCEYYLKIKMLIFRFYDFGKKFLYKYELWISLIHHARDTKI
jgi:hypothetical protein